MSSPHHQLILIALLMSAATLATSSLHRISEPSGVLVVIKNNLEGKQNLQVHCKDKHTDYGVHQVPSNQEYDFHIDPGFFNADYFCGFVFDNVLHWFDIYLDKRDKSRCNSSCNWFVKESGPCFGDPNNNCYPWNQN